MESTSPEKAFQESLRRAVVKATGLEIDLVPLTYPPSASLGDMASPLCFELARIARKPPRALAESIVAAFEPGGSIEKVEVAGGGYINATLNRTAFLRQWLADGWGVPPAGTGPKVIVEHTNINPNKAAHIGHLRNAVLGDTLVRCLRMLGHRVEVQNYIDDTGVQVADLVVAFRVLRGEEIEQVLERYTEETLARQRRRLDYIAWDLYAEVTRWFEEDPSRRSARDETLHAMEAGGNAVASLAAHLSRRMVRHHLATMDRIGVRYDLLPRESDILRLRFWDDAFARLRGSGAVHWVEQGKNAGCWVMDLPGVEQGAGEDQKIIVRSNGTVTYVGKDMAYQLWKFGLLERDFRYALFDWGSETARRYDLWATCSTAQQGQPDPPAFGKAQIVYNVIDTRQSYLQRVVTLGLRSLGFEAEAERSIHFAYEMVALTPAAVEAMFPDYPLTDEDRSKPYLEMSGRKGLGVRADDLLDTLVTRASVEVRKRNPALDEEALAGTASRIAVGALRYYMLRFSRNRVVAFDLDDALAFEGETGPYLQYSVVRARNILGKVAERYGAMEVDPRLLAQDIELRCITGEALDEHWTLALLLSRVEAVLRQGIEALELASVAKHAYVLAQTFNSFYHRYPVAQEGVAATRRLRTGLVSLYHQGMVQLLGVMGVEVPERM